MNLLYGWSVSASWPFVMSQSGHQRRLDLKIFCWVCSRRRDFRMPQQSTLAVCNCCGNPEGAIRQLVPAELAIRGLETPVGLVDAILSGNLSQA